MALGVNVPTAEVVALVCVTGSVDGSTALPSGPQAQ
jgi:hypothetical protein